MKYNYYGDMDCRCRGKTLQGNNGYLATCVYIRSALNLFLCKKEKKKKKCNSIFSFVPGCFLATFHFSS